jgi:hypothetical protein
LGSKTPAGMESAGHAMLKAERNTNQAGMVTE